MYTKVKELFQKETVCCIAFLLAVISIFFVSPSKNYISYIDFRVLALLFCLMAVVRGFSSIGVFTRLGTMLLTHVHSLRMLSALFIFLCFFFSMLITNDVALITFVPFAVLVLQLTNQMQRLAWVVTLQTIAANIGSMLTPVGNPQNLYLSSFYGMDAASFFAVTIPVVALSFCLLAICCLWGKNRQIEVRFEYKEVIRSPKRLTVFLALFGLSLLSVLHLVGNHRAFLLTVLILLVADRSVLKKVDYWLLATFVCFFIFAGNMGAIPSVQHFLGNVMERNTMLCAVASSQIISNVPAAVLLSNFTRDAKGMLLGTNIGGLGTLVASLASLISFKLYARTPQAKLLPYLGIFTAANAAMLVLLYLFAAICL